MSPSNELELSVKRSWHGFLETYEPLRADLYRYCRHLTKSPWDAEDLAQDTLARAFVTLGQLGTTPPNARLATSAEDLTGCPDGALIGCTEILLRRVADRTHAKR